MGNPKYITYENPDTKENEIIMFGSTQQHQEIYSRYLKRPKLIGAGFCELRLVEDEEGEEIARVKCIGESNSLNIAVSEIDTDLLINLFYSNNRIDKNNLTFEMSTSPKYITYEDNNSSLSSENIIIFNNESNHKNMASLLGEVRLIGAGFCDLENRTDLRGIERAMVKCMGKSDSLNIECSEEDELISMALFL